jgi:hypothetical protein
MRAVDRVRRCKTFLHEIRQVGVFMVQKHGQKFMNASSQEHTHSVSLWGLRTFAVTASNVLTSRIRSEYSAVQNKPRFFTDKSAIMYIRHLQQ